jgi:hypothetical protein
MREQDTQRPAEEHPRDDDLNEEERGSPVPDPEEDRGDAEDVPGAD